MKSPARPDSEAGCSSVFGWFGATAPSAFAVLSMMLLSSCAGSRAGVGTIVPVADRGLKGIVHGGQQPVTGSTIQLYAVGTTGDGSAATPMLTQPVMTDQYGNFSLTGLYTCPTDTTEVYLTSTGGNPGLGANVNNPSLAMMAALGQCGALTASSFVFVNELTTVASLAPLAGYMTGYAALGSGAGDVSAFDTALAMVNEYTDTSTGQVPGPMLPPGYYASQTEINTLGDILAPCINSAGGVAGDGSICGQLFTLTTPASGVAPTDTIGAALQILASPQSNLSPLLSLIPADSPFQPILTAPPASIAPSIIPIVATPNIAPASGTFYEYVDLSMTDTTPGATIYYTLDGTMPTVSSTVYTTDFLIVSSVTVKAIAVASGQINSAVATVQYTLIQPVTPPPTFSPAAGTYGTAQNVYINSPAAQTYGNARTYYTLDGSTPTSASSVYNGSPILVSASETIKAITNLYQYNPNPSAVATASYAIEQFSPPPTFYPAGGVYASPTSVSISSAGSGATIFYTTDGSTPTPASSQYSGPIQLSANTSLKALVVTPGYVNATSGATYLFGDPTAVQNIYTFAGNGNAAYSGDENPGGPFQGSPAANLGIATAASVSQPNGVALDAVGNVYIADTNNNVIRKVDTNGIISTYAGNNILASEVLLNSPGGCYQGDGGPALQACLNGPTGLAFDKNGNLYIADSGNNVIRKVDSNGTMSTFAGNPSSIYGPGYTGPEYAYEASIRTPIAVAVDSIGNVYIAAYGDDRVLEVSVAGYVTTVAGDGTQNYAGDGGPANQSEFVSIGGLAIDSQDNLYVSDNGVGVIREISGGIINTIAGVGQPGFGGDGGPAVQAQLQCPTGLAIDLAGNIYSSDSCANVIRKITVADGNINTIAGGGTLDVLGDDGPALGAASLLAPTALAVSNLGNLFIADTGGLAYSGQTGVDTHYNRIREVAYSFTLGATEVAISQPFSGVIHIASTTPGVSIFYTLDGSVPTTASTPYKNNFLIYGSQTVNAAAFRESFQTGYATAVFDLPAAFPTFSIPGGTYDQPQQVTISSPGATIYCTTDGSAPTLNSPVCSGPVTVNTTLTLKAIAYIDAVNGPTSSVSETFNLVAATPSLSPNGTNLTHETIPNAQGVYVYDDTPGATVYYTTDGSTPTHSSPYFVSDTQNPNNQIQISTNITILSFASAPGFQDSAIVNNTYTFQTATPYTQLLDTGCCSLSPWTIGIVDGTLNADIYYTTDGSTPTTSSTHYTGPFTIRPQYYNYYFSILAVHAGFANSVIYHVDFGCGTSCQP